jgi:hypothetical protein
VLYECSDCNFKLVSKPWDRPGDLCPSCGTGNLHPSGEGWKPQVNLQADERLG